MFIDIINLINLLLFNENGILFDKYLLSIQVVIHFCTHLLGFVNV
jgi:hypothetical protein